MTAIEVDDEVEIRRSRPDVFAFVSDREHVPAWTAGIKRVRRTSPPGPVGTGTTYQVVGQMLGRRVESAYEITAFEPDQSFSGRMASPYFDLEETYRFEEDEAGTTRMRFTSTIRPGTRLRLLAPLLAVAVPRQARTDNRRLKTILEKRRSRTKLTGG